MGAGASVPAPGQISDRNNNTAQQPQLPNLSAFNNILAKSKTEGSQSADSSPTTIAFRSQIKAPAWTEIPVTDCVLVIGKESLFIRDVGTGAPIRVVPFYEIVCWGYNQNTLEVRLFGTMFQREKGNTVDVLFPTHEGAQIAVKLFDAVQALKKAIDNHNLSSEDFDTLLMVLREDKTRAQQKELQILRSFGGARQIQSTQAVQILQQLDYLSRFDLLEAACILYERLLNKDTVYLIFEQLRDNGEKENLRHRLGLKAIPTLQV